MSYCRKEGKDVIIFATEEDLKEPSKVTLLPDDPNDLDTSHQGAILPNGDINWDCPCLGNLPNGPCGPAFRGAFTCWVENKNDQDAFSEKCFENFTQWEACLSQNREIYKSSKRGEDEVENEDPSTSSPTKDSDDEDRATPELQSSVPDEESLPKGPGSSVDARPAIAAAYAEETPK